MSRRPAHVLLAVGCVLSGVGLTGAVVLQVKPWRACPDDTSPAACPMLPADYDVFLASVLVLVAGVVVLLSGAAIRLKARSDHR